MSSVDHPRNTGRLLSFNTHSNEELEVVDHIEKRRCKIRIQEHVDPRDIPSDNFYFPIDRGVSIVVKQLSLPYTVACYIRNHTGIMVDRITDGDDKSFPNDQYNIEISAPVKLYFAIESSFHIKCTSEELKIVFEGPTEVFVGVRSHHESPAAKIVTPPNPEEMMKTISHFGSALKTATCERSYPTLRGHPPEIELGDDLHIPPVIKKPETGIEIEIPRNFRSVYVIAPLAYYFGANIVPGDSFVIRTSHGFEYNISNKNRRVDKEVEEILKQCFFLDCLTRTEGYYKINLYERRELEPEINIDFGKLYGQDTSKQFERYLNVEYSQIESHIPRWKQAAYVETCPENVDKLPFLIHDLATIHPAEYAKRARSETKSTIKLDEQSRRSAGNMYRSSRGRSVRAETESDDLDQEMFDCIDIPDYNSTERTWVGDGIPIGANKSVPAAFRNRLNRESTEGNIEISVVVNDDNMIQEGEVVNDVYGSRKELTPNVNIHHNLDKNGLYDTLQEDIDFLHYIGHIDKSGFQCIDGHLDVENIDNSGIDTFFLNACSSYKQAVGLINAGSIAGIATIKPVLNSGAERVGESIARLLNHGFPLVVALDLAKSKSIMGDNYVVIGDGGLDLTQPKSGIPSSCEIIKKDGFFVLRYITYPTRSKSIGSITIPYVKNNDQFYLTSGITGEFNMKIDGLLKFLSKENLPVKFNSKLYWSDKISVDELTG